MTTEEFRAWAKRWVGEQSEAAIESLERPGTTVEAIEAVAYAALLEAGAKGAHLCGDKFTRMSGQYSVAEAACRRLAHELEQAPAGSRTGGE